MINILVALLLVIYMAAALIVLLGTGLAVHNMTAATSHWIRMSHVLLAIGAFAGLLYPFWFEWFPTPDLLVMVGAAILFIADKRSTLVDLWRRTAGNPIRQ